MDLGARRDGILYSVCYCLDCRMRSCLVLLEPWAAGPLYRRGELLPVEWHCQLTPGCVGPVSTIPDDMACEHQSPAETDIDGDLHAGWIVSLPSWLLIV